MALDDLLDGQPITAAGIALLITALRQKGDELRRQLDDAALADPNPPRGMLEAIQKTRTDLSRVDTKLGHVSDRLDEAQLGPAFEQQVIAALAPGLPKNEKELAGELGQIEQTDVWDIAAWLSGAADAGVVEQIGDTENVPLRRWAVTDAVSKREAYRQAGNKPS